MEIARELALEIYPNTGVLEKFAAFQRDITESIIAAKLKPVRDAMKSLYRACDVNDHTVITLELAESVIAMFEDAVEVEDAAETSS